MHPILAVRRRLEVTLAAWALAGATLAVLVRAMFGVPWQTAMVFGVPLGLAAVPVSLSAWYLCRAMPIDRTPLWRLAGASAGAALLTSAVWATIGRSWWQGMNALGLPQPDVSLPSLFTLLVGYGALAYLLALSATYVMVAAEASADAKRRELEIKVQAREAELLSLRAQIDPHFLYNSLTAIVALLESDLGRARQMCQMLAQFLRDSQQLIKVEEISVERELALVEQYLDIEKVRFGHRLTVRVEAEPESLNIAIPPLLLQPLVENAVRHGIAMCLDGGTVDVQARVTGRRAVITVSNPCDAPGRPGTRLGQQLVRRRLQTAFGDEGALVLERTDDRYQATVTLPARPVKPANESQAPARAAQVIR